MIYTDLVAAIRSEAQLDNDTNWDARILLLLNEELVNLASLQNAEQLHITDVALVAANQTVGQLVDLPVDFLKPDKFRFTTGTTKWILPTNNGIIPPVPVPNKPRAYELHTNFIDGTSKIRLIPSFALGADIVTVDYFAKPIPRVGADLVAPDSWIPPLKRAVMERVLNYHINDPARSADSFSKLNAQSQMGAVKVPQEIAKPEKGYDSPRSA